LKKDKIRSLSKAKKFLDYQHGHEDLTNFENSRKSASATMVIDVVTFIERLRARQFNSYAFISSNVEEESICGMCGLE